MNSKKILSFLFSIVITSTFALDWGAKGHRTTGEIAEKHLTRKAKRKIDKLLKGESLAFVSTWPDQIKSDRKFKEFSPWHYINMGLDENYHDCHKNPKGDLASGINKCIKILKDKTAKEEDKRFYLKMLVHLIGDLHQPLHIGEKENKGGNTIQVQWFRKGSNLHRVWDTNMLEEWGMSYNELAENTKELTKRQIKCMQEGSIIDWIDETHKITKKVYASAKKGEKLSYRYSYDYFPTVRDQLQKGGIRLAKILNDIFG